MLLDLSDLDSLKTIITHFPLQRKLVLLLVLLPLGLAVASRCCYKDLGHSPIRRDKNYPTFYLLVMAADGCQWMESPNGSGAEAPWPEPYTSFDNNNTFATADAWQEIAQDVFTSNTDVEDDYSSLSTAHVFGTDLPPGAVMSTKVPPAWSGRGSWFAYEELVNDW